MKTLSRVCLTLAILILPVAICNLPVALVFGVLVLASMATGG